MSSSTRLDVPNGLLCIEGLGEVENEEALYAFKLEWLIDRSYFCFYMACQHPDDGETKVTLGEGQEVDPGSSPAFDCMVHTPDPAIKVIIVPNEKILETTVPTSSTRVRIWVNHPQWPDEVIIGLG